MANEAILRWSPVSPDSRHVIFMDNVAATCILNKESSLNQVAADCMRSLRAWYNADVKAFYIPGHCNHTADGISRFYMPGQIPTDIAVTGPHGQSIFFMPGASLPAAWLFSSTHQQ